MTGFFSFGRGRPAADTGTRQQKGIGAKLIKEFKAHVHDKRYAAALRCGDEYVRKVGDHNHDLFFTMGAICYTQKKYANALLYLDKALEIGSYDTEALLVKAQSHVMLGQKKHAIESCKKIQEIDPENTRAVEIIDSLEDDKKKGQHRQ